MKNIFGRIKNIWRGFRQIIGDDAYERYLAHWQSHHADDGPPLSRKDFYAEDQARKWNGVRRCC